jgi:hypothetical protein
MKKVTLLILLVCVLFPTCLWADEFLGAPVLPGGKVVKQTDSRLEKTYDKSYEDVLNFYKEALKGQEDIKFRDRGWHTFIEDHSNRPWHSITVSKLEGGGVSVVTVKDNWTWILGTLVLRFFGVFGVLICLYIALAISGAILKRTGKAQAPQKA